MTNNISSKLKKRYEHVLNAVSEIPVLDELDTSISDIAEALYKAEQQSYGQILMIDASRLNKWLVDIKDFVRLVEKELAE